MKYLTIITLSFTYGFFFKPSPVSVAVFAVALGITVELLGPANSFRIKRITKQKEISNVR